MKYEKKVIIFSAFMLSFFILGIFSWLGSNDVIYLINEYIDFDSSLFPNNLLRYGNAISSKYMSDALSGFLFKCISWQQVRLLTYLLVVIILSISFINFAIRLQMNYIAVSVILMAVMSIQAVSGNLAIYTTNLLGGNYDRLGGAIGVLAISFCFGMPKWNVAMILAALAGVFHIHEGMYSGAFVLVLWIANEMANRKTILKNSNLKKIVPGMLIWSAIILISVIPPLVTNVTIYSSKKYIDNFIWKRLANHIMPFKWGALAISTQIITWGIIVAFIVLYGYKKEKSRLDRKYLYYAGGCILSCGIIILLSILFIDIFPIRFFANLFMAKFFPFAGFVYIALLVKLIDEMLSDDFRYLAIGITLLVPISNWVILVLLPIIILHAFLKLSNLSENNKKIMYILSVIVLFFAVIILINFYIKSNNISITYNFNYALYWLVILMSGFAVEYLISKQVLVRKYMLLAISGILLINLSYYTSKICYNKPDRTLSLKTSEYYIEHLTTEDLRTLAKELQKVSDNDTVVLADPRDFKNNLAASWFQVLSLRDVYVTDKVIVYTDSGVQEWNERLDKLLNWDSFSEDDFYNIMKDIDSKYILLDYEDKQKLHDSSLFKCILDTSTYALYEINN